MDVFIREVANSIDRLSNTIVPRGVLPGNDKTGGKVEILTESVMGVTAGLCRIADAINNLAEAVREHGSNDAIDT